MKSDLNSLVITNVFCLLLLCAAPGSATSVHEPAASDRVTEALQPFVTNHVLAGAVVLWADKDRVLGLEAVGYSDVAKVIPMKTDALFWIASMSKPLTATALMMLVDEGKIKLTDPVEKYLPEFHGQWLAAEQDGEHQLLKAPLRPITIEDVLSHTSGLPFMSRVEHKIDSYSLKEAALGYALTALNAEPGRKYDYSNAGINTAGRIIEVVSGLPYEEFMRRRLFGPLGMKDTTLWPTESQLRRLAKSYKPNARKDGLEETTISQLTYPLNSRARYPSPAGGYFSSAHDLSLFCRMILNGGVYQGKRIVSEAAIKEMTTVHTGELLGKNGNGYGLGWSVSHRPQNGSVENTGTFGHGGAYSTDMQIDIDHQLITIYLVQHAGYPGDAGGRIVAAFRKAALEASAASIGGPDAFDLWQHGALRGANVMQAQCTVEDLRVLRSWGANLAEIPVSNVYAPIPPYAFQPENLARLDQAVEAAEQAHLYVALTCREGPGRPDFNRSHEIWRDAAAQDAYAKMWQAVASHYPGRRSIVGYDLMCEPHPDEEAKRPLGDWNALAKKITAAIREVDKDTPILVNSSGWAYPQLFEALRPTGDPRTVYTVHFYDPHYYTHQKPADKIVYPGFRLPGKPDVAWDHAVLEAQLAPVRAFQQKYQVPIFVGEFGCARYAPGVEEWMRDQLDLYERFGWSWAYWAFREWDVMNIERTADAADKVNHPDAPLLRLFKEYFSKDAQFLAAGSADLRSAVTPTSSRHLAER